MWIGGVVLAAGLACGGIETPLDTFSYADDMAARSAWQADAETPPVQAGSAGDRPGMVMTVPFDTDRQLPRTVLDRRVALDLRSAGSFTLGLSVLGDEPPGRLSLYFRSGAGWYAGGGSLAKGDQQLRFSKASFAVEGNPAGWQQVDGIRLSVWRGANVDAQVVFHRLAAVEQEVAVIFPPPEQNRNGESRAARDVADRVTEMLGELGLGCDAIESTAVAAGALGQRRVALLAYNPGLSDEAVDALASFLAAGGKVLACYSLPPRLATALGFQRGDYVRFPPGGIAEIRFQSDVIAGLPDTARQASWNINVATPVAYNARVVGRWYDELGNPTGYPALLVSDRGAFLTHIVLADDRDAKLRMLAAVLGHLEPELWRQMGRAAVERSAQVGPFTEWPPAAAWLALPVTRAQAVHAAEFDRAAQETLAARADMEAAFAQRDYHVTVERAQGARESLRRAYLLAQPSPVREGRAWWNHSGTGAYPGDWERTARELEENGCNMVIPNLLWAGRAHYPSEVLPRSSTFQEHGDQIAQCLAACRRHGIQVHVWKVNFNLSGAPREFVERLRREGRTQVDVTGEPLDWLNPAHPENFCLELESMVEVVRKYDVDGLHFDYIRYPHGNADYSDFSRRQFEKELGHAVNHWPDDCYRGDLKEAYRTWRCRQISRLVEAVSREAKRVKPDVKISAAVFGAYPDCRASVGQDWPAWVAAGWLDFTCPMDYTPSNTSFERLVRNQLKLVDNRVPVYPGIGATASRSRLSADRVVSQIAIARKLGAAGFTVFNLSPDTAADILPGMGLGATARPALPPP